MSKTDPQTDTETLKLEFTGVWVHTPVIVAVASVCEELVEENVDHALMYFWIHDEWSTIKYPDAIVAVAALRLDPVELLFLAPNGTVYRRFKGQDYEEEIDPGDEGPSDLVHMRHMRVIDGKVFAVGMARHAYVRGRGGSWAAIDATCFVPREKRTKAVGFNAVDGFSEKDVFAVGHKGEIWHYDGKKWTEQDSPTNVALTTVRCAPGGTVYAGGLAGTLLKGQRGRWSVIEQTVTKDNFWSVRTFRSHVFVSNYEGVFRLDGDDLVPIKLKTRGSPTTAYLDCNEHAIWSVGHQDFFFSKDGRKWVEVERP